MYCCYNCAFWNQFYQAFFLLDKTFLQFLLFTNWTNVFFDFCLPASVSWPSTYIPILAKSDNADPSNVSSETKSEISFRITLFQQPCCAKALWSDLYVVQRLPTCSHFRLNFSSTFWWSLITISFRFKNLSFRESILLVILFYISFITYYIVLHILLLSLGIIIMIHNYLPISYYSYYSLQTTVHTNEMELQITFT